jgi:hypothetical protein
LDSSKANIAIGEHAFVLSMQEDLEQGYIRLKSGSGFFCVNFQQISLIVSQEDFGLTQFSVPLNSPLTTKIAQLPCFLPSIFAPNGSCVLFNRAIFQQRAHRPAHVRWMLGACLGDSRSRQFRPDHIAIGLCLVVVQMKQDAV